MKQDLLNIINEINRERKKTNYIAVEVEELPKGYFSSRELSRKYNIQKRRVQEKISEELERRTLLVKFVRLATNGIFVRKTPVYKFKNKKDEKSFKSRLKGKRR